jgi:hypothetical protein
VTQAASPPRRSRPALGQLLARLDEPKQALDHDILRDMTAGAVRELCDRYRLKISSR